jgi:hypothetical protein
VLTWYRQNPNDWQKTWQLIEDKYQDNPDYRRFSCNKGDFNIDAKINGAYIVMGLLYGEGDPDKTIIISTRCGQDSDCNPSNSGGVLFTTIGFKNLPDKFKSALNPEGKFSHTPYNFPTLVEVSKKLVRQAVTRAGGRVEENAKGQEVFVIPVRKPSHSGPKAQTQQARDVLGAGPGCKQQVYRSRDGADQSPRKTQKIEPPKAKYPQRRRQPKHYRRLLAFGFAMPFRLASAQRDRAWIDARSRL